jgi:hypothetical protein
VSVISPPVPRATVETEALFKEARRRRRRRLLVGVLALIGIAMLVSVAILRSNGGPAGPSAFQGSGNGSSLAALLAPHGTLTGVATPPVGQYPSDGPPIRVPLRLLHHGQIVASEIAIADRANRFQPRYTFIVRAGTYQLISPGFRQYVKIMDGGVTHLDLPPAK